ncbi:MAG: PBP1A family penicillin-binding protein [Gemmatimonadota bacterium]
MRCGEEGCPDPTALPSLLPGGAPVLLDRHGEPFAELHPLERRLVPLDSIPDYVQKAFIAVEDRRFYSHGGVDWPRLLAAGVASIRPGGSPHGASTITMQLARTLFPQRLPSQERTIRRKLLEIRVARRLERNFSKDEILEIYLNHVYVGAGAYGVSAGAHHYFNLPPHELGASEAAFLAGVINAPARLNPRRHLEPAISRRNLVLTLMEQQGFLSSDDAVAGRRSGLHFPDEPPALRAPTVAAYFVDAVRRYLEEELGEALYRTRLTIHTTLDPAAQAAAEEELTRQLAAVEEGAFGPYDAPGYDLQNPAAASGTNYLQGSVVVMEAASGDVLALVGGRDFAHSRFNRATSSRRPMGSAFKPFVVAAGLSQGLAASQPVADRPLQMVEADGSVWRPQNFDGRFRGTVRLREALVSSLNVPIIRVALATGLPNLVETARLAGIREAIPASPAVALGTVSISPLEMAEAYTNFPLLGERSKPRFVVRVENQEGTVVLEVPQERHPGLDADVAYVVTDMLRAVVDRGTGWSVRQAGFTGRGAGKTGTSQQTHDTWFVGFTPEVVTAVWMGFDTPRPIVPGGSGGRLAAPVWGRIMARIPRDEGSGSEWPIPPGVTARNVDPISGLILLEGCPPLSGTAAMELFLTRFMPRADCPIQPGLASRLLGFLRGSGPEEAEDVGTEGGPWASQWLSVESSSEALLGEPRITPILR